MLSGIRTSRFAPLHAIFFGLKDYKKLWASARGRYGFGIRGIRNRNFRKSELELELELDLRFRFVRSTRVRVSPQ